MRKQEAHHHAGPHASTKSHDATVEEDRHGATGRLKHRALTACHAALSMKSGKSHHAADEDDHGPTDEDSPSPTRKHKHRAHGLSIHAALAKSHHAPKEDSHDAAEEDSHAATRRHKHRAHTLYHAALSMKSAKSHHAPTEDSHGAAEEDNHGANHRHKRRAHTLYHAALSMKPSKSHHGPEEDSHGATRRHNHRAHTAYHAALSVKSHHHASDGDGHVASRGVHKRATYCPAADHSSRKVEFGSNRSTKSSHNAGDEEHHEEEHEDPDATAKRAVMVRSIYSTARRCLSQQLSGASLSDQPQIGRGTSSKRFSVESIQEAQPTEDDAATKQDDSPKKLTFKMAASAVRQGAKTSVLGRNAVQTFLEHMFSCKKEREAEEVERERLVKERLERESEVAADRAELLFHRQGSALLDGLQEKKDFLSSVMDELEQLRTKGSDDSSALIEEIKNNMEVLRLKMAALTNLYSQDRRNCAALTDAIDICQKDVRARFAKMSVNIMDLCGTVEGGDNIAGSVKQVEAEFTAEPPSPTASKLSIGRWLASVSPDGSRRPSVAPMEFGSDDLSPRHQRFALRKKTKEMFLAGQDTESPHQAAAKLWRKAAGLPDKATSGFMGALHAAMAKVRQEKDNTPSRRSSGLRPSPDASPRPSGSRPSPDASRRPSAAFTGFGMDSPEFAPASPDGDTSPRPAVSPAPEIEKPLTAETTVPVSSAGSIRTLIEEERPKIPRRILQPIMYPAIGGDAIVLPTSVDECILGNGDDVDRQYLEQRLKCPFVLMPLVPTKPATPSKERKSLRRTLKKRDNSKPTLEAVLADRERRGLRQEDLLIDELDVECINL